MNTGAFSRRIIWLVSIASASIGSAQSDPMTILQKLYDNRDGANSIHYEVDFRIKSFAEEDTIQHRANVHLLRKPEDTIFHGWVSLDLDSIWLGYDGRYVYLGDKVKSQLTRADPVQYPGVYIQSTLYGNLVEEGFLNTQRKLIDLIQSGDVHVEFVDTLCQGAPCLGLLIPLPDQEGFTNPRVFMAIDKEKGYIRQRSYRVFFQENEQYQEWNFSNTIFNAETMIPALEETALAQYAKFAEYNPSTKKEGESEMDTGPETIQLKGVLLTDRSEVELSAISAEYILLDFWYSSCYPCIKSIPHVNELHAALSGKGVAIYGVNPFDKLDKDGPRLEKFLRNNPMKYPTIMPDEASRAGLNISGYPTFLILDQDRHIIYSSTGFDEKLFDEVMAFLGSVLKN